MGFTQGDGLRPSSMPLLCLLFAACNLMPNVYALSDHPLVLIVSFDGFRYDFLDNATLKTPNLDALIASGVRARWLQPRFISKTFPNHFSIATGLYEESHGIVANSFYDPELNETFNMASLGSEWWDVGGIPVWVLNQLQPGRFSGGMMWPGTNARIKNQTAHHVVTYKAGVPFTERVDTVIEWFLHDLEPANLVYLYFEEPDHAEHAFGPEDRRVMKVVESVDLNVGYLVDRLQETGLFDRVNLIITSDHGMTDVPKENVMYMADFIDPSTFRFFGMSPVWSILPNPGLEQEVFDTFLNASKQYHFSVYLKDDIPESYHYRNNRRVMPILVSMDEHYDLFLDREQWNPNETVGNHGYNNSLMSMQAIFVGHGPQFRQGYMSEPFMNIDIFPLACHLLGIEPTPNNGTMEVVKKLLRTRRRVVNVDDTILVVLSGLLSVCVLAAVFAVIRLRLKSHQRLQTKKKDRERISSGGNGDRRFYASEEIQSLLFAQ